MAMKKCMFIICVVFFVFALSCSAYAGLTDGLVAYYPFNGNANDESGKENHGTKYGVISITDRFGNSNSAYSFDGVDDYIEIDKIASQLKGVGTGTISIWFKVKDNDQSDGSLFSYGDGLNSKYSGNSIFVGPLSGYLSGEGVSGIINPNLFFGYEVGDDFYYYDSKWHNAVFLMGSNYNELYMDGQKVPLTYTTFTDPSKWTGNANTGNILWTNIQNASIGRACADYYKLYGQSSTYYFTGSIDDVRIYNRALSESEIKQIFDENINDECYTEADLEAARQEQKSQCQKNPSSCGITSDGGEAATLSEDLSLLHIPLVHYQTLFGNIPCWLDMTYAPIDNRVLFEVTNFGLIE